MAESILNSVKTALAVAPEDTVFDAELVLHINGVLAELHQLGVGPAAGFMIADKDETWEDFLGVIDSAQDPRLNSVKSYIHLKVKMIFDPPEVGYVLTAYEKLIEQAQWRVTIAADEIKRPYVEPVVVEEDDPLPIQI